MKKLTFIPAALIALSLAACGEATLNDNLGKTVDARSKDSLDASIYAMMVLSENKKEREEFKNALRKVEIICRRSNAPAIEGAECDDKYGLAHLFHGKTAAEIIAVHKDFVKADKTYQANKG